MSDDRPVSTETGAQVHIWSLDGRESGTYRTEDLEGVKDFARGSMRSYLLYKEKARRWNEDKEIQALIREVGAAPTDGLPSVDAYSRTAAESLKAASWIDETIAFYRNEEILK